MATPHFRTALVLAALSSICQPVGNAPAAEPLPRSISIHLDSPDQHHEAAIRHALTQPTQIEMVDTPLVDVMQYLSDLHKIQILIDHKALEEVGVSIDTLITFQVEYISLESALELMLRGYDLTWVVENGVLQITSQDQAEQHLTTRIYPVGDLVQRNAEGVADYKMLIGMIQNTIAMTNWDDAGGLGAIEPYAGALVISTTEQVHRQLESLFHALRKLESQSQEARSSNTGSPSSADEGAGNQ